MIPGVRACCSLQVRIAVAGGVSGGVWRALWRRECLGSSVIDVRATGDAAVDAGLCVACAGIAECGAGS
jgi:hypothetical protein